MLRPAPALACLGSLRHALIVSGILAGTLGVAGQAQQTLTPSDSRQQSEATFRTDANFVEIDAVVTDERGNPIKDLSKDEFEVYEDGKRQIPSVFALVDLPLASPASGISKANAVESDVRSTRRTFDGRLYVIVLDDLHTTTTRTPVVRNAAKRFIQDHLAPGDLAAVVQTSGRTDAAQELTSSRRMLLQAVDKFLGQKMPSAATEKLAVHLYENGIRSEAGGSNSSPQSQNPLTDPYDAERAMNARRMFELVRNVAGWMADIQGRRKALVLFSEGIDYDIYDVFNNRSATTLMQDARDTIAAAQRANVSISAVDPRGLTLAGDDTLASASASGDPQIREISPAAFRNELLLSQESLIALAEETGGTAAVRTNDIPGALARIARDNSTYYLLGYHTDPTRSPGKFRKIEVRVKRPGLTVKARRGFMAPNPKVLKTRETPASAGASPALRAAMSNPLPVGTLPLRVFAAPFKGEGKNASILVAVEIDGPSLKFNERDGRFHDTIEVSIAAVNYQGKVVDPKLQTFRLALTPDMYAMSGKGGIRILSRLDLPPARYQLRVGVHDSVGNGTGTVPYDLDVADYSKTPFALSGTLLASSQHGGIMTMKPDPQLKDVLAVPPTAVRTFQRNETLTVVGQLYVASAPSAQTIELLTTVRSADDDRIVVEKRDERAAPGGTGASAEWYTSEIPLQNLAPGRYVLKVQAASRASKQLAVQEVPFEVR